jgi:hypothetical protein
MTSVWTGRRIRRHRCQRRLTEDRDYTLQYEYSGHAVFPQGYVETSTSIVRVECWTVRWAGREPGNTRFTHLLRIRRRSQLVLGMLFSPEMITPHEHQAEHDGHDAEEGCGRGGAWCQRESITGVIHEDKDKDKDKEVEHRRQLRRDSQTGENDTDEKTSSSHHRRLIASSPRLTVKRNMHGKRRVVPRRVPRLEDLRTDNGAQSVGDEHEGEDCDFFGLAGCGEWGVSV